MIEMNRQHYIIFDIDSNSVGVLVFDLVLGKNKKKRHFKQIFTQRKKITKGTDVDFDMFFTQTVNALTAVAEQAHISSGNNIAEIYINVSAPWSSSQKRVLHFEKNKEFIFTQEIANTIIEKELGQSLHGTRDYRDEDDLVLIERRTTDVYANGYPTKKPYGKKVIDVDIHSLTSVMSKSTHDAFSHVIEKTFHRQPDHFFSNRFMVYQTLIQLFPTEDNITSLDISAEATEIGIIIDDHLKKIGVIPVGSHSIIRHLAQSLQVPFSKAESVLKMYQHSVLEEKYQKNIESAMKKAFLFWFKHFYAFLDEVSAEHLIPETLMVLAPEELQKWFHEWILKTEELREHMHLKRDIRLLDFRLIFNETQKQEYADIHDDNLAFCLFFVQNFLLQEVR